MPVATLQTHSYDARREYAKYLRAVREGNRDHDVLALKNAYRELARSETVIDINQAMHIGGLNVDGRPVFAICRAHFSWCAYFTNHSENAGSFVGQTERTSQWHRGRNRRVRLASGVFAGTQKSGIAQVPSVPIDIRPRNLSRYHVLWEAEWRPLPPVDPYLLRHLGGPFYLVVAQWDLTELERSILRAKI